MVKEPLEAMNWALDRGVVGILALVVMALAAVVIVLQRKNEELYKQQKADSDELFERFEKLQNQRLDDLNKLNSLLSAQMEKVHESIKTLERFYESLERRSLPGRMRP